MPEYEAAANEQDREYAKMLKKALLIATDAHANQQRDDGRTYLDHVLRVFSNV